MRHVGFEESEACTLTCLGSSNRDHITDQQRIPRKKLPFAAAVDLNFLFGCRHAPQLGEVSEPLADDSALKGHEHEKSEQRVIPVAVQHPEPHAEDLPENVMY